MQRMPPNMPPRKNDPNGMSQPTSPALHMARRIRSEQGAEQARQYLVAMEPYLAPAERRHIAEQVGVSLPTRQESAPVQNAAAPSAGGANPLAGLGGMGGANPLVALGNMGGGNGGGGNPMQLLQMLSGMGGSGGGRGSLGNMGGMGNMGNMMQMMQALGPLLGGKK